ncbi:MAG: hypothetical protein JOZ81_27090 [Chloroflexi bacterium]|nr:hypothetical protein [Chloroflexota bacterium]
MQTDRAAPVRAAAPQLVTRALRSVQATIERSGGYVVNTSCTVNTPHPPTITDKSLLVPEQTAPTIGDRLNDAGVTWAWYSGGWNNAVLGHADPLFQFISPFARRGFVDHTQYDTTSILKFIEERWNLEPLTDRDARGGDLLSAFDFSQSS